jgi:hypothetical protein
VASAAEEAAHRRGDVRSADFGERVPTAKADGRRFTVTSILDGSLDGSPRRRSATFLHRVPQNRAVLRRASYCRWQTAQVTGIRPERLVG